MIEIANDRFRAVLEGLGEGLTAASPDSVELLFDDDVPVRVSLHPEGHQVLIDAFAYDGTGLIGQTRRSVVRMLLQLNGLAVQGRHFATAITPTGLVAVVVNVPLVSAEKDGIADQVDYAVKQAKALRSMLTAFAPSDRVSVASFV
jgi:hypothetical protein